MDEAVHLALSSKLGPCVSFCPALIKPAAFVADSFVILYEAALHMHMQMRGSFSPKLFCLHPGFLLQYFIEFVPLNQDFPSNG